VSGEEVGAEFLTHLWHAGESGEEIELGGVPVRVQVGQSMKLRAPDGSGSEVLIKGEYAAQSEELFSALHRGALIVQAKVQLDINGTVVTGNLKAATLTLSGVKLPKEPEKEMAIYSEKGEKPGEATDDNRENLENEARLLTRMALLDQGQDAVDAWFESFLKRRATPQHKKQSDVMRAWVAEQVKSQVQGVRGLTRETAGEP